MTRTRTIITAVIAGLAAAVSAAPAGAATQSFAGVLEDGRLVTFTSQAPAALSTPRPVRGMEPRELILALGARQGRVVALGSAARLYALDVATGRATAVAGGRPIGQGLRGRTFSLALTADGARARVLSDVGQDVFVDLATGAETPGPGVRREDGTPMRPAVTSALDGRLVGIDLQSRVLVRETRPESGVVATTPLKLFREDPLGIVPPSAFALGADGRAFLVGALSDEGRTRQSRMITFDAAGTALTRGRGYFFRRIVTLAALREVREDRTPPRARITLPPRVSVRTLLREGRVPLSVRTPEAFQLIVSLRVDTPTGVRRVGGSLTSRDTPGALRPASLFLNASERRVLRRAAGDRIRVVVSVNDLAGNGRSVIRQTRLAR